MLLKLPIMLLSNAPKISLLCSNIMLRAVSLCPKHFTGECSIKVFNYLNECFIGVFYLSGDCSIRVYQSFLSQLEIIAIISALLNNKKANLANLQLS